MKNNIIQQYESFEEQGLYNDGANMIAEHLGLKMKVISSKYGLYFQGDKQQRYVFKIRLIKGGKQYTFEFGQRLRAGSSEPTFYDVLVCLTKYDPETFEDFCANYDYDEDSRTAERIYKAVVKEWENMNRLFTSEELDLLTIIQ